jgi:hypothetical protein
MGHLAYCCARLAGLAKQAAARPYAGVVANPTPPHGERHWPVQLVVVVAAVAHVGLSPPLVLGPGWLWLTLTLGLLLPLGLIHPVRHINEGRGVRLMAIVLTALINLGNFTSLGLLVMALLDGSQTVGRTLLANAFALWITNLIGFALWYWELDGGGPAIRHNQAYRDHATPADFLFPQMSMPTTSSDGHTWQPLFADYLFLSFTTTTAFSPTDTLPLSRRAKLLIMLQASSSLVTIALVAARAVNILK